jgi:hypothetical protein
MKNIIHISEPVGARFDIALDQLECGLGFDFRGVWFRKDYDQLQCEAVSPVSRESLTEHAAIAMIVHARSLFDELRATSSRFTSITNALAVRFSVIEDYGTGTTTVVELVGDELVWR